MILSTDTEAFSALVERVACVYSTKGSRITKKHREMAFGCRFRRASNDDPLEGERENGLR